MCARNFGRSLHERTRAFSCAKTGLVDAGFLMCFRAHPFRARRTLAGSLHERTRAFSRAKSGLVDAGSPGVASFRAHLFFVCTEPFRACAREKHELSFVRRERPHGVMDAGRTHDAQLSAEHEVLRVEKPMLFERYGAVQKCWARRACEKPHTAGICGGASVPVMCPTRRPYFVAYRVGWVAGVHFGGCMRG